MYNHGLTGYREEENPLVILATVIRTGRSERAGRHNLRRSSAGIYICAQTAASTGFRLGRTTV